MIVYIPNGIYDKCKSHNESMEEFIRNVFREWDEEFLINYEDVRKEIGQIVVIDSNFGT